MEILAILLGWNDDFGKAKNHPLIHPFNDTPCSNEYSGAKYNTYSGVKGATYSG
jgi:hypothetical protein